MKPAAFDDADHLMGGGRGNGRAALPALDLVAEEEQVGLNLGFAQERGTADCGTADSPSGACAAEDFVCVAKSFDGVATKGMEV